MAGVMATTELSSRYGTKSAKDIGIGVNSTGPFAEKFISWLVFWFVLKVVFLIGSAVDRLCVDLGMAFVDNWVVGNEKS